MEDSVHANEHFHQDINNDRHLHNEESNSYNEESSSEGISVLGMQVDRAWFDGLLQTLPAGQQRQLSQLMVETIGDHFPDLLNHGDFSPSDHSNGFSRSAGASHEVYKLGSQSDSEDDDTDDTDDEEEVVDYGDDQDEEDDADDEDIDDDDDPDEDDSDDADDYTANHDNDTFQGAPQGRTIKRGKAGSYLNRFSSTRIRQGLTIWEELSITIPAFMEEYVAAYVTDAGMLIHQSGNASGGLATVHILFHLTGHRRAVCRLLDLVLEAEDGTIGKRDFMAGGAFASLEEENSLHQSHRTSEIDYDCSDASTQQIQLLQGGYRYGRSGQPPISSYLNTSIQTRQPTATRRAR